MLEILAVFAIVALDRLTKIWAGASLKPIGNIPILRDVLHLTYVENTGAAFSILRGQTLFLTVIPAVAAVIICYLLISKKAVHPLSRWALVFILSGALGNLIDRVFWGYVIDFFDFRLIKFAIFNVADIFITLGAAGLFLYVLFISDGKDTANGKDGDCNT